MARTREQQRRYQREYRARQSASVTRLPETSANSVTTGVTPAGSVAAAVMAEIAKLSDRGIGRPGLAAVAVTLAELLDDVTARPQHPAAAGRLREVLGELREGQAVAPTGKLAQLRATRAGRTDRELA